MLYSSVLNWQCDCTFIDKSLCFPADSSLLSCFIYDVLYQLFASWSLCRDTEWMWYGWPPGPSSLRATWVWSCCGHPTSPPRQTAPTMVCFSGWLVMARELRRTTRQTSSSATEGTGVVWLKWWVMEVLRFTHVKEEIRVLWLGKDREFEWDQPHDPIAQTLTLCSGWAVPGEDCTLIYILEPHLVLCKISKMGAQAQSKQCSQLEQWPFDFIIALFVPWLSWGREGSLSPNRR